MRALIASGVLMGLIGGSLAQSANPEDLIPDRIVLGFAEPDAAARWVTVNDNVMGGRSIGGFEVRDGRLVFAGSTNTDGGGFSSVRTRPAEWGLDGTDGIMLHVRGDGRTYIASLETDARIGGFAVNYWAEFATSGNGRFETIRIPISAFKPRFMGEPVGGVAALDPGDIRTIGLFIYDKKDGPFALEVEWIGTIPRSIGTGPTAEQGPSHLEAEAAKALALIEKAIALGVPRFNAGQPGACADIYEIAIESLRLWPTTLPPAAAAALSRGIVDGPRQASDSERAWAYRRALDAAYDAICSSGPITDRGDGPG